MRTILAVLLALVLFGFVEIASAGDPALCPPQCCCGCKQGGPCGPCTVREMPVKAAPVAPEKLCGAETADISATPRYLLNGKEITRQQATDEVGQQPAPLIPDDSKTLRLVVIGPQADRKRVVDDLASHPSLAPWRGKLLVTSYDPSNLICQRKGYATGPGIVIYLQTPEGKVIARSTDGSYKGPEALAKALDAKAQGYSPGKDADLWASALLPIPGLGSKFKLPDLSAVPWSLWAVGAGLAALLFLRGKGEEQRG